MNGKTITYHLAGRTALVTGAASGIGFATATMLAEAGATVAVNFLRDDRRGPEAVERLKAAGGKAIAAPGSVADPGEAEAMVRAALDQLGRLDILVNNAGAAGVKKVVEPARLDLITEELWAKLLDTNLVGVFRCAKAASSALREARGAIVNVASVSGLDLPGSSLAYAATKAGVINLTKNLARALAPEVRVNAVAPGAVDSSWEVEWTEEKRRASAEKALLKRRCAPEDIAEVIIFLAVGGRMVTGTTVVVDGGLML
jgi:3-oxoacyl-[acyl-carrier protein] reductase